MFDFREGFFKRNENLSVFQFSFITLKIMQLQLPTIRLNYMEKNRATRYRNCRENLYSVKI